MDAVLSLSGDHLHRLPVDKNDLIDMLKKIDTNGQYLMDDGQLWIKSKIIAAAEEFNDHAFQIFKCKFGAILKSNQRSETLSSLFLDKFQAKYPDEFINLIEFISFHNDNYGIKIHFGGQTYLFDFSGTIDELVDAMSEEMELHLGDMVHCPYCNQEKSRHHWHDRTICDCGAEIVMDTSKEHKTTDKNRSKWVGDAEELIGRSKQYKSVGKSSSGYGMWFKKPDPNFTLNGTLENRKHNFANYLRYRQLKVGYVPNEMIEEISDRDLLDSYRFCPNCQEHIYSIEDENRALMECTSMDSAFDMMVDKDQRHGIKHVDNDLED